MNEDMLRRWRQAEAETAAAGIGPWTAKPPFTRMLLALNLPVRPPHYAEFWSNVLSMGVYFAAVWGLLMWALLWRQSATPLAVGVSASILAGVLFGLWMAVYYRRAKRKHNLSDWSQL